MKVKKNSFTIRIIFFHFLLGSLVFYFLLHPLLMVGFAAQNKQLTTAELWDNVTTQIVNAFSFQMLPMTYVFLLVGGLIGIISGIYWVNILRQKEIVKKQNKLLVNDARALIKEGENNLVEFKSSFRYDYKLRTTNNDLELVIAKTIAGFLNAEGGKLVIGVDDEGKILGLKKDFATLRQKNADGFERRFFDLITTSFGNNYCKKCSIRFYKIDNQEISIIHVEPSTKPVYIEHQNRTLFFVRAGNATRNLTVKEAVQYIEERN
ncbi:MAG: AAA family ATPase [Verrucomicrobia bacterium]|nr:AAA family ATPase [Verrucomicrobiota bacterium]